MKIASIQENRMNDIKRNLQFSCGELQVIINDIPKTSFENNCLVITLNSQIEMLNVSLEILENIS